MLHSMATALRTLSAILALGVLAGCASATASFQPSRLALLNIGMTKDEVLKLLGRPQQAGTSNDGLEAFRYSEHRRGTVGTNYYGVVFRSGQVTDYGPGAGIRLGGHYSLRDVFTDSWQQNSNLNSTR